MAFTRIILWLGISSLICSAIMALTAVSGLFLREFAAAQTFAFIALICALLGGLLTFSASNASVQESTSDALIFLLLFWVITPFILTLPFHLSGLMSGFSVSYFETVSAFTTTGASTLIPESLPRTFLIWRSLLQFCGGVIVSTFAVVILAALNLSGTGVHKSKLFTLKRGELFPRLIAIGSIVGVIYLIIAILCFIGLMITGTGVVDAICLALSAISTGGLTPQTGPMASYVSRFGAIFLAISCILGASNVALLWDFIRLKKRPDNLRFVSNLEHRGLFFMVGILVLIGVLYAGVSNFFDVVVEAVYMVTTTGFDYNVIGIDVVPRSVLISFALIGGSAISTAGGIKIIRLLLLMRHAFTDVDRMSHPSRVKLVHFRGQILPDKAFLSIWMYFFGYTIFFAASILALGAAGLNFPLAVSAGAAALSNMGPLLDVTFPETGYREMSSLQLSLLSIVMLVGRVEVLAAIAAFSPSLWKR